MIKRIILPWLLVLVASAARAQVPSITVQDLTVLGSCSGCSSAGLPVVDTTSIVKGSGDPTKLLRFEVDGFTSGQTRVATFPNQNITVAGVDFANSFSADQTFQNVTVNGTCTGCGSSSFTANVTITKQNPTVVFAPATVGDSSYAFGVSHDGGADDNDGLVVYKAAAQGTCPVVGFGHGFSGFTNLTLAGNTMFVFTKASPCATKTDWRGLTIHDATGNGDPMLSGTGAGTGAGSALYLQGNSGSKASLNFMVGGTSWAGVSGLDGSLWATQANGSGSLLTDWETVTTGDDPTEKMAQWRITTTDATPTALATFTIPTTNTEEIACSVVSRRTGGSGGSTDDGAAYELLVAVKNPAGTVAEIAPETVTIVAESQAAWDVTAAPSTNTEVISVTGAANNNITWHATCRYRMLGS